MFRQKTLVLGICGALSGAGCASFDDQSTWRVEPDYGIQHGGTTSESLYRLGRHYQGRIRYDGAIAAYREALQRNPGFAEAHNGLGVIYAAQGRYDEAIREFEAAVALAPLAAHLHNNLGYAYVLRGANERAVTILERARELDPGNKKMLHNLQLAQQRLGRTVTPGAATAPAGRSEPATPPRSKPIEAAVVTAAAPDPGVRLVRVEENIYELRTLVARPLAAADRPEPGKVARGQPAAAPKPFKLEVSNGNGIEGMARRVAGHLQQAGVTAGRLTNQLPYDQAHTEIQYREGYSAEAAKVRATLAQGVPVVTSASLRSDIHVRLVLGRDVRSDTALFERGAPTAVLAASAPATTQ